jgi:hypothetical protein
MKENKKVFFKVKAGKNKPGYVMAGAHVGQDFFDDTSK